MAGPWPLLRSILRNCVAGTLVGVTVNDRYASVVTVRGTSMNPTLEPQQGDRALVSRLCLDARYGLSRGDVVVFRSPTEHRSLVVKRLIALPGDWIQVPAAQEIRQIPVGHCWVEGDNPDVSWDSRSYGPIVMLSEFLIGLTRFSDITMGFIEQSHTMEFWKSTEVIT
uniref:Mitochondrial inner membrane protease subunit 2 n=1 Tax=Oryza glumipatula TaxID=40148 RepID=A0A0D9ZGX4_9ORYZ